MPPSASSLLTGNSRLNALLKLRAAGIDIDLFDLDISSFYDTRLSRLALVYDFVAKLETYCGIPVHVADVTPMDIECAKRAGCSVVAVATGHYMRDQLAPSQPDIACEQLPEILEHLSKLMTRHTMNGIASGIEKRERG